MKETILDGLTERDRRIEAAIDRIWFSLTRSFPTLLTFLGLLFGIAGVVLFPSIYGVVLLVLSMCIDWIDGSLARTLKAETKLGSELDWTTDTAIAYSLAWKAFPQLAPAIVIVMVLLQISSRLNKLRYKMSGRTTITILAIGNWILAKILL
jgi:phosphatidylglycerophosphate synthase